MLCAELCQILSRQRHMVQFYKKKNEKGTRAEITGGNAKMNT